MNRAVNERRPLKEEENIKSNEDDGEISIRRNEGERELEARFEKEIQDTLG
jgi:hypothetical protein